MVNKKVEETEEIVEEISNTDLSKSGRVFLFPKEGIAIAAKNRGEAQKKYEELSKTKENK